MSEESPDQLTSAVEIHPGAIRNEAGEIVGHVAAEVDADGHLVVRWPDTSSWPAGNYTEDGTEVVWIEKTEAAEQLTERETR